MTNSELLTLDPIRLGHKAALGVLRPAAPGDERAITAEERVSLLNDAASQLGLYHRPYWIEAKYGVTLPTERDVIDARDLEKYAINSEDDLEFTGSFSGYSRIKVGKLLVSRELWRVTGLCATFDKARFLSGMVSLEEDRILHVPILAVDMVEPSNISLDI